MSYAIDNHILTELNEISSEVIAENLRLNLDKNLQGNCPTGHDSKGHKCFSINKRLNLFHCFHCHISGNNIQLIQLLLNLNFREACKWLAEQYRPDLLQQIQDYSPADYKKYQQEKDFLDQVYQALTISATYQHELLKVNSIAQTYIKTRGIQDAQLWENKYFSFGYSPANDTKLYKTLVKQFSPEIALATGLFQNFNGEVKPFFKDLITVAYLVGGQVKYIVGRSPSTTEKIFRKLQTKNNSEYSKITNQLFGVDSLEIKNDFFKNSCLIAEGLFDAILAILNGIPTISPLTTRIPEEQIPNILKYTKNLNAVYICPDIEENQSGLSGAIETAKTLFQADRDINIITLPKPEEVEKIDLADYFTAGHTLEDFIKLCKNALPLIDFLIELIPLDYDKTKLNDKLQELEIIQLIQHQQDPITTEHYQNVLSKRFGLTKKTIESLFKSEQTEEPKPQIEKTTYQQGQTPQWEFFTDTWNAERLVERHGENIRFCHPWNSWFIWDGRRWQIDKADEIQNKAKETVRSFYVRAGETLDDDRRAKLVKHAQSSESYNKRKAMIALTQCEVPILPEKLDQNKWLLNLANGTLNLETGQLKPHNKDSFITKLINIDYNPKANCSTWLKFLDRIFEGNANLIRFIQKAIGYSLTGNTYEQCIFILHGTGANGKTTFLTTINELLEEYGQQTPSETLMLKKYSGAVPNDLARLRGARFVSSIETEEGRCFAEVLVKQLTGEDIITARFLFSEFFEFRPECKFWLASNHKPRIRGTDYAIWRRIRLIPFNVTIPEKERDLMLLDKLRQEKEGILAWAIEGCRIWQEEGLKAPEEIKKATQKYRDEMDILGGFIEDCCVIGEEYKTTAKELYETYSKWCEENGEKVISQRAFGLKLAERNFINIRTRILGKIARQWCGIGLLDY